MLVMVDIRGDRGSLVRLANKVRAACLGVAGAWMGMGRESELTSGQQAAA